MFWLTFAEAAAVVAAQSTPLPQPSIAPPPPWVRPFQQPATSSQDDGRPIKLILRDQQLNFTADGAVEEYAESVARVQTADGLDALGNISLAWNPDTSRLTIHKLEIVRAGKHIDLLTSGHGFTVLRRETNLELAQLDGVLTATMQVEGLQVGDVLDFAYTMHEADPALHSEQQATAGGWMPGTSQAHLTARWPAARPLRWQATSDLPNPIVSREGGDTLLSLDLRDVPTIVLPKGAPPRFYRNRLIDFTSATSWGTVAALMQPLYAKAATLGSASPLKAEAARIRASTPDPRGRAESALALVQDQIRYFFVGLNDGGYVPADADLTWSRRFGDCKGKTVLLLALLHELGIDAVPALVSTFRGDGLDKHLPMAGVFDHVLVRATIGGKTYWLDGTRAGDRRLDDIDVPPFRWALPLTGPDSSLVALAVEPAKTPLSSTTLTIDASAGIYVPAKIHGETEIRGDAAYMTKQALASIPADQRDKTLKEGAKAQYSLTDVTAVAARYDNTTGKEIVTFDGTFELSWQNYRLRPSQVQFGERDTFERDPGPGADAPFALPFPFSIDNTFTLLLPQGGKGFTVEGAANFDRVIAGTEYSRHTSLVGTRFTVEAKARTLALEVPASEGIAAREPLNALSNQPVLLGIPRGYYPDHAERDAIIAADAKTVTDYIHKSWVLGNSGRHTEAVDAATKGLALDPDNTTLLGNRAIDNYWLGRKDAAQADVDAALARSPNNAIALRAKGALEMQKGDHAAALSDLSRSLQGEPGNAFALGLRAFVYAQTSNFDRALDDAMAARSAAPDGLRPYTLSADIHRLLGRPQDSLADIKAMIDANPENPNAYLNAGNLYDKLQRHDEAARAYERSLAIKPMSETYFLRAYNTPEGRDGDRERDLQAALKLNPKSSQALAALAHLRHRQGRFSEAAAFWDRALAVDPNDVDLQANRANDVAAAGDNTAAARDYATIRSNAAGHADQLNELCWAQATGGAASAVMLADCDAALALKPDDPSIINSRGLALLRLGRNQEAFDAYDAAVKGEPQSPNSLYGRGIAEMRLNKNEAAKSDMDAATLRDPEILQEFKSYGVLK